MADERLVRVLTACLRSRWDSTALSYVRSAVKAPEFDWVDLITHAVRENVAPLLYSVLRTQPSLLPADLEAELRAVYFQNARRNLLLFKELTKVLHALDAADMTVMVLKGAALAETVYENMAVRPMSDLDLLVREEAAPRALQVLKGMGFQPEFPRAYKAEVKFERVTDIRVNLELHWDFFVVPAYAYILDRGWFWETAKPWQLDGAPALTLGTEARILYLCGHLYLHHRYPKVQSRATLWLQDIAEIIATKQIDWSLVMEKAQTEHLVLPTQRVLLSLQKEWRPPMPSAVLAALEALTPTAEEVRLSRIGEPDSSALLPQLRRDLRTLPTWRARLDFTRRNLFPPPRYMRALYSDASDGLLRCYLRRWWQMIKREP